MTVLTFITGQNQRALLAVLHDVKGKKNGTKTYVQMQLVTTHHCGFMISSKAVSCVSHCFCSALLPGNISMGTFIQVLFP